jgi:hypothetical protein
MNRLRNAIDAALILVLALNAWLLVVSILDSDWPFVARSSIIVALCIASLTISAKREP